jgi:hypothetical protein
MWGWIKTAWEGVKGLIGGGKGTTQIGKGNQSAATGDNSPVYQAGRDVHFNVPIQQPVKDEEAEMFAELERLMPDLLNALRQELAEHPLVRDMIVLDRKSIGYNWPGPHLMYSEDETPNIRMQMGILEGHGMVRDNKSDGFAYRISERLVRYLKKGKASPGGSGTGG